mgnify:CR=1 FL=1
MVVLDSVLGEAMLDARYYKKCSDHAQSNLDSNTTLCSNNVGSYNIGKISSLSLRALSESSDLVRYTES